MKKKPITEMRSIASKLVRQMASILFLFCCSVTLMAQNGVSFKGKIVDKDGEPLAGAVITVVGSTKGAAADMDGNFELPNVTEGTKLRASYLGMQDKDLTFDGKNNVTITLEEQASELEEVTVVAFGRQKKASVVASIQTVNTKDLKIASSNLTTAFAGKIPGMISYQTSGEPGADNAQFFVRGVTTFGYKADPLILIDGFEATTDDLARLQPDDVESFSILKDASATVLYGARGANGIILISTKAGQEGGVKINARLDVNTATPTRMNDMLDATSYMRLYNEARITRNPELGPYYSEQKIQSTERGDNPMIYPDVNWYDMLFKSYTINTKANINLSGGGKVARYYVSGGYENETGLLKVDKRNNFNNNIDIDRVHIRSNVIFKLTESMTLDTRVSGRFEKYNGPYLTASDVFSQVMNANPVDFPTYFAPDADHQFTEHILFGGTFVDGGLKSNPYASMVSGYEDRNESTMTAQATLTQDFGKWVEGLKFQAKASVNSWSKYTSRRAYAPYYYDVDSYNMVTGEYKLFCLNPTSGQAYLGNVIPGRDASGHYYYEARFNWDRKFGLHNVGAMTVGMAEENLLTGGNSTSIYETLPERNMGNSGRLTYDYDSRYFFEFSYGYNGSEKFTGEKKYGFFPSYGFGYLVSNEDFFAEYKNTVSNLKLKFTYGRVGNDAISGRSGRFFFLSNIALSGGSYNFGDAFMNSYPGYTIMRYANPDITWEVSDKYNLGFELSLLKNEDIKFQIDFFKDIRSQIYMERQNFPSTAGLEASISGNVGRVSSQGIDGSLDLQHSFTPDFWLQGRANLTYADNKYLELDEKNYPDEYLKRKGYNINQQWGLVAERLFVDDEEIANSPKQDFGEYEAGDIKYKDINGDGVINDNDRVPIGYPTVPKMQYGFGLSTGYKKFDFSFFFQGNSMVTFFINTGTSNNGIAPFTSRRNALSYIADSYWSETNPDVHAFWPRLSINTIANNSRQSTWWMRDGSFLRLKTIEAGYNFDTFKRIGLENTRLYFSAENMFVVSPFKLWDPETGANGLGYPLNRRFNIGVYVQF
ncbi:MAG: TonB-dependent receptor [Tannerella sp.]|jgi:TonB-linked SusC/RagA family outer membrane protein|nr:TonB-dependent receptor [Tannerella sp.]